MSELVIPGIDTASIPKSKDKPSLVSRPTTTFSSQRMNSSLVVETSEDMINSETRYTILNFGITSTGKTHFGFTMPEPVVVIDTENRAAIIVGKFKACIECGKTWSKPSMKCPSCNSTNIRPKDIRRIKVRTMEDIYNAVKIAMDILEEEKSRTGKVGTLMIDSVTEVWTQAQQEHINKQYGGNKDAKLSPRDDYKIINPRHNDLRKLIIDSGFNVYLTATQGDLYGEDQFNPIGVRPEGQKHNPYAVDYFMFSFIENGELKVRLEKNSIALRQADKHTAFDFEKLQNVAKILMEQEKMITASILEKVKANQTPPTSTPTPTAEVKEPVAEQAAANKPVATVPTATVPTASVPTQSAPTATVPAASVPGANVPKATVPTASVPGASVPGANVPATEAKKPTEEAKK